MYRNTTQLQLDPTQATAPSESLLPQGASIALILMAAGSSSRFAQSSPKTHAIKKQWLRIGEKPLWLFVADTLSAIYPFVQIRITASEQEASYMQKLCSYEIVIGGETRQESLRNALQGIESEWVLVSDVARAGIVAVARKIISALIVTSLDSRDNAQNLNNSQTAGLCGNNTEAQNVFCSQLAGGRIFDEKAGLCSGEQGDKTWASIDAASHKLPAFSQKANAQNTQVDCVAPILAVPDTAIYDESYIDRSKLFRVQTPQLSRVSALRAALESTQDQGTDESSIIKANGGIVRYIQGDRALEKLTLASDMAALEQILGQAQSWQHAAPFAPMPTLRVGNGLDVHSFEIGKVMKLGGVVIESEFGFKAHSDGDVALHSVIDAILGAMGAGDIGEWFPDSSSAWEGADSARLLEIVWGFARSVGYELCNLDLTIIAQKPRLGAYKQPIRARIAEILGVPLSAINVKATTTEQLGFVGRAEGVCAMSSVSLRIVSFAEVAQSYQLYKG